jgi:hypothetical protein
MMSRSRDGFQDGSGSLACGGMPHDPCRVGGAIQNSVAAIAAGCEYRIENALHSRALSC